MGKITISITLIWLVYSSIFNQFVSSDRYICNNENIDTTNIRNNVIDTLISYIGTKETTGNNDGPKVEMFIATTGLNPKGGYPWCAAFIAYGLKVNGLQLPQYPARAASYFDSIHIVPNLKAITGDVFSLYYTSLGRIGHIGMYLKPYVNSSPYIVSVEGNTNAQGSREGNQVAKRFRLRGVIYNSADWIKL